jgi:hypothetical protein
MTTRLPAPEQLMLVPLNEMELAELIERHIDFVDKFGRSVHLPSSFVRHYMKRNDGGLPIATSVAQTPIVLYDGTVLAGPGLDRRCGIVFRIPDELMALLPIREQCTAAAVGKAMRFLSDEWLCDVACTYADKCILIACALTVLERALLPQRPAFFVTAGQRGGGKTTTIHMISMATLGLPASAAAGHQSRKSGVKRSSPTSAPACQCWSGTISRAVPSSPAPQSKKRSPPSSTVTASSVCPR